MNKYQANKEILELEIKLARLKIAAAHLKQQKLTEAERAQQQKLENTFFRLVDLGSGFARGGFVRQAARLPINKKYRNGLLLAWFAWQLWQKRSK